MRTLPLPPLSPLFAALALLACSGEDASLAVPPADPPADPPYVPPPESCDAPDLDDIRTFVPCSTGSGIFGTWVVDGLGLPAYDYGLDENADERAAFFNTEKKDRREHWAAFGNGRVNALAYNDGYIEVTTQDRGVTYLNKFDEPQQAFAGGFSYLDDGGATWSTAYKWRPRGAKTTRRFGMGYAEASMEYRGIGTTRRTLAPAGDAPVVVDEVTLENRSSTPKHLRHYEYWDVARRPIEINWMVSGIPLAGTPAGAAKARDERNGMFDESVAWDADAKTLGLRRAYTSPTPAPGRDEPSAIDAYPGDPFLAVLSGSADDVYTDQAAFFGAGGVASPDAVFGRSAGEGTASGPRGATTSGDGQPRAFVVRTDVDLAPGEKKTLRFAYGYAPMGQPFEVEPSWGDLGEDPRVPYVAELEKHLVYAAADRDPVLHRELAWHAYQLEASVGRRDYWNTHVVPQGSAYLYLHGADGAGRDLALFAVPLTFTHPSLAREELTMLMGQHRASDHLFVYAFQGNGELDDALGLHAQPSDTDIFFLWAMSEYLGATGDDTFLDASVPYWPKASSPPATVYDHVHDAVRHLFDVVGTGEHGLIALGDGDWSDGIVMEAKDRDLAVAKGESVPNTQMAVATLPLVANVVESRDAALADEIRAKVASLKGALSSAWAGQFYGRAFFGDGKLAHADAPTLESQVWALIGDEAATPADRKALLAAVETELDDPSPTGAMLSPGGQVWPAVSALLTWGYAIYDPERAFAHLARNTMAAHAVTFPSIWYGIWSGPDGLESTTGERPGEAWYSVVTPMTDFPVMNANQHAMPLLAWLKVAGAQPFAGGVAIAPHVPGRYFSFATELLDLSQRGAELAGTYRPLTERELIVYAPAGGSIVSATVDGAPVAVTPGLASIMLAAQPNGGAGTRFDVTWTY